MADELLPYYEKELAFIRQMGAEFAKEHPKIAGRLGVSSETIEDPHVSRLIESFAYLNARIQIGETLNQTRDMRVFDGFRTDTQSTCNFWMLLGKFRAHLADESQFFFVIGE